MSDVDFLSSSPIKICIVTSWFPNREQPLRAPFVSDFSMRLRKAGVKVSVITDRRSSDPKFESIDGTPVFRARKDFPLLEMFRRIREIKPDIIHIHAPNQFSSYAVLIGKLLRIPVVATIHRVEVQPLRNKYVHVMRRIVLSSCDRIIPVSKVTKLRARNCGARENRTMVIYNSADESIFRPRIKEDSRNLIHLPFEKDVILYVGRLSHLKGVRHLIQAMPLILEKREAILVIVGNGPEKSALERLVKKSNLQEAVLFTHQPHTEELGLYYNATDVFVLPSLMEGHSVVLLEAMASGLPVVATNIGGNNESVVDQVNGLLVRPKNPEELAEAIIRILSDPTLKHDLSRKSLEIYNRNFAEKIQLSKYFSVYQELLMHTRRFD